MSPLTSFERLVESLVERSLIAPLRGRLQPIEIAKRLERAMRDGALSSVDDQLAPNEYLARLHPDDLAPFAEATARLESELALYLSRSAADLGYAFVSLPTVKLVADPSVHRKGVVVSARVRERPAQVEARHRTAAPVAQPPQAAALLGPRFDFGGWSVPLGDRVLTVGRAPDRDIVLPLPSVSRNHAEITPTPRGPVVRDLGSTNGTTVNGRPVDDQPLQPGARVAFGGVEGVYLVDGARAARS